jgi:hypothetical protein
MKIGGIWISSDFGVHEGAKNQLSMDTQGRETMELLHWTPERTFVYTDGAEVHYHENSNA